MTKDEMIKKLREENAKLKSQAIKLATVYGALSELKHLRDIDHDIYDDDYNDNYDGDEGDVGDYDDED